jgi:hypothetical protein
MSNTPQSHRLFVRPGVDAASVCIRDSGRDDLIALQRLAQLDSTRLPAGPHMVAEVGGQMRAAYSLNEQRAIADPFHRTAELVELLHLHAVQVDARQRNGCRGRRRRRRRSIASQPPGFGPGLLPRPSHRAV